MYRYLLFLFFVCVNLQAQTSSGPAMIDAAGINIPWLEHLIKIRVDSVRKAHGLGSLVNDSTCYLAAKDHASYLTGRAGLSHNQDKIRKRTPKDRVNFYGAVDYQAGENLARIYVLTPMKGSGKRKNKTVVIRTYEDAAYELVNNWVNSPAHFKNMLVPLYRITGLAIGYSPATGELNAVQVFANVPAYFVPAGSARLFPYAQGYATGLYTSTRRTPAESHSKHAWNIRSNAKDKDFAAWEKYESNLDFSSLNTTGRVVVFNGGLYKEAQKFLKKRQDGMMAEIVPFSRYDCTSGEYNLPARRNGGCIFNGLALKPIYRNELLNTNFFGKVPKRKPKKISLALGRIPTDVTYPMEVNILVLKRRNVVGKVQFHHLADTLFQYTPTLPYLSMGPPGICDCYMPDHKDLTKKFLFQYRVNETAVDSAILDSLRNFLKNPKNIFQGINIKSYASIEGNFGINNQLYNERARIIHDSLRAYLSPRIPVTESAGENWRQLEIQLKDPRYKWMAGMDTITLRIAMNDSAETSLKNMLDGQRYSLVEANYRVLTTKKDYIRMALDEYQQMHLEQRIRWARTNGQMQVNTGTRTRMKTAYDFLLRCCLDSLVPYSIIDSLPLLLNPMPGNEANDPMAELFEKKILFDLFFRRDSLTDSSLFRAYLFLAFMTDKPDPKAFYNYEAFLINHFEDPAYDYKKLGNLNKLKTNIEAFAKIINPTELEKIRLFYHFAYVNKIAGGEVEKYKDARPSLQYIFDYYSGTGCSNKYRVALAHLFLKFQYYRLANDILEPVTYLPDRDKGAYTLWLKILYAGTGVESLDYNSYQPLFDAADWLSPKEFCNLFEADERINFQLLDYEPLHNLYCKMKMKSIGSRP